VSDTNEPASQNRGKNDEASLGDVIEFVKAYAKQETLGPLKGVGRWLAFGAAAAFVMGLGLMIMLLGVLRLVQTEWDRAASGSLSWLAYLITFIVTVVLLIVTLLRVKKSTLNKEPK
jgi:cytochrome c biogenesis protein CcdA